MGLSIRSPHQAGPGHLAQSRDTLRLGLGRYQLPFLVDLSGRHVAARSGRSLRDVAIRAQDNERRSELGDRQPGFEPGGSQNTRKDAVLSRRRDRALLGTHYSRSLRSRMVCDDFCVRGIFGESRCSSGSARTTATFMFPKTTARAGPMSPSPTFRSSRSSASSIRRRMMRGRPMWRLRVSNSPISDPICTKRWITARVARRLRTGSPRTISLVPFVKTRFGRGSFTRVRSGRLCVFR